MSKLWVGACMESFIAVISLVRVINGELMFLIPLIVCAGAAVALCCALGININEP